MKISESIKNKTKEERTLEDLKEVKEVLDKHNVEFWLDCGVLLGAVREQKFIPWDSDIDLGTWDKDTAKIISACQELQNRGFGIQLDREGMGIKRATSFIPIGIWLYRLIDDKAIRKWGSYNASRLLRRFLHNLFWMLLAPHYSGINPKRILGMKNFIRISLANIGYLMPRFIKNWATKIELRWGPRYTWVIPSHYFRDLSIIKFYGMEFKIPAKTEEYLIYRYGENWRVPKRNWDTAKDDGGIFKNL